MSAVCKVVVSFGFVILLLALPADAAWADGPPSSPNYPGFVQASPEEEYHRAIYDLCLFYMAYGTDSRKELKRAQDACNVFSEWIRQSGWYEKRSPGWQRIVEPGPVWEGGV